MPEHIYDVIVVGGGPAGAHLAYLLARGGYQTLLLEKDAPERSKCCAGAVSPKAIALLAEDPESLFEDKLYHVRLTFRGTQELRYSSPKPIAGLVMRHRFDAWLRQRAREAGAEVRTQTEAVAIAIEADKVKVKTRSRAGDAASGHNEATTVCTGRILAGADGAGSLVARASGLHRNLPRGIAVESEIPLPAEALLPWRQTALIDYGLVPWGYAWVFPKQKHLSVGLGSFSGKKIPLRAYFAPFCAGQNLPPAPLAGHPIPYGTRPRPLQRERVLLLGDAASLADPFSGEGIYAALASAAMAAEAIDGAFRRGVFIFPAYQERVDRELLREMAVFWFLARWFYRFPRFFHRLFHRHPELVAAYFRTVQGELSGRALLTRLRRKLLPFPML